MTPPRFYARKYRADDPAKMYLPRSGEPWPAVDGQIWYWVCDRDTGANVSLDLYRRLVWSAQPRLRGPDLEYFGGRETALWLASRANQASASMAALLP